MIYINTDLKYQDKEMQYTSQGQIQNILNDILKDTAQMNGIIYIFTLTSPST